MTARNHTALDNPVWHALHSHHAALAVGDALAKKYPPRTTPMAERVLELGNYYGVREGSRLAAIAGERLHLTGYTEVSGVCTHPDFRGRGYAGQLVALLVKRITARGKTPFLHLKTSNEAAQRVYESLGFRRRRLINLLVTEPHAT
jgi:predicted GNAT family acetyltransferase